MRESSPATLVVAPNWVGDLVMAEPVFRALAASGRRLAVLIKPGLAPLAPLLPGVEEVLERPGEPARAIELLRGRFEETVVLPHSFRSAWIVARAGIPRRYGYRGDGRSLLLSPAVKRPRGRRLQVEDYRELLEALGVPPPESWVPRLELPEELLSRGRERWQRAGIDLARLRGEGGVLVGLMPGAEWGPSKRWPWPRFAELARELRRAVPGVRIAILCGPKELWTAVRIHEESGHFHPVIGPDLDLAGLAAVLADLDCAVTNDSGPMHLAAALGVPAVALFGPTDPRRTAPSGEGHRVLTRNLWCSPCFRRRCPLLHHGCLRGIAPAAVLEAVVEILEPRRAPTEP